MNYVVNCLNYFDIGSVIAHNKTQNGNNIKTPFLFVNGGCIFVVI